MILIVGVSGTGKSTEARSLVRAQTDRGAVYSFDLWGQYPGRVCKREISRASKGIAVSYRPPVAPYTEEARQEADKLVNWVDNNGGTLVLDEIQTYYDPMKPLTGSLLRLAHQPTKHPPAGVIIAAQRFQFIHAHLRAGVKLLYAFRQTAARDVRMLYDTISSTIGEELGRYLAFEYLPKQPNYNYARINLTGDPSQEVVTYGVTRK